MEKRIILQIQKGKKWQQLQYFGGKISDILKTFAEIALWNGKGTRVCNRRGDACNVSLTGWVERNWWHYLDDEMYLTLSERKVARDITTQESRRPCNILSNAGPTTTLCDRGKESENIWQVWQTTQLNLLPESSRDCDFRQIFQQDYPPNFEAHSDLTDIMIAW